MSKAVEFWYDFASTYSYLAAMRIEPEAATRSVSVLWRPFLLGPIFREQGWETSPFNVLPAKGRFMWQDMARQCTRYGLPWLGEGAAPFPQNSVLAARVALIAAGDAWVAGFTRAAYVANFGQGRDIADPGTIADIVAGLGHDPADVLARATAEDNKTALRRQVATASRLDIFGAPTFIVPGPARAGLGDIFWGQDRMLDALDAAAAA